MTSFIEIPDRDRFVLRNATIPACLIDGLPPASPIDADGLFHTDLSVDNGRISGISPVGQDDSSISEVDLDGSMVWPCFVDVHTHIDKGHIWPRQRNPNGTRAGALSSTGADRAANWTAEDVRARMNFSLESAYAHGTAAIRTHLDSTPPQHKITWPVVSELRDTWAGRIDLQAVCLEPIWGYADRGFGVEIADMMVEHGGIMGAVLNVQDDTDALLDFVIGLAIDRGLELDFHVDEMNDPAANSFDHIAEALIRNDFGKPVNVGHCCSLAIRPQAEIDHALDLAVKANMRVTSLPMCNMYLQDRPEPGAPPRTPRWRGVTILHEMKARGIPVAISSDNTRDPFYAYGDLDGAEVFTQAGLTASIMRASKRPEFLYWSGSA
ncbi:MAG: cytosine deaminase, partial [Alphaproteobacteria bacterium]